MHPLRAQIPTGKTDVQPRLVAPKIAQPATARPANARPANARSANARSANAQQSNAQPSIEHPSAFPRRIDRTATEAQGRFIVILGVCTLLTLVWSAVVQIDKVARLGRIVTQQTKQQVQHLEGGIIAEILVKEGDTVVAGQPLMRVENSFFKSELAQAAIEQAAKRARIVRLDAETSGAKELKFPPEIAAASRQVVDNEISLFRRRQANLNEQLSILAQQQRQKEIELSELRSRQPSVVANARSRKNGFQPQASFRDGRHRTMSAWKPSAAAASHFTLSDLPRDSAHRGCTFRNRATQGRGGLRFRPMRKRTRQNATDLES